MAPQRVAQAAERTAALAEATGWEEYKGIWRHMRPYASGRYFPCRQCGYLTHQNDMDESLRQCHLKESLEDGTEKFWWICAPCEAELQITESADEDLAHLDWQDLAEDEKGSSHWHCLGGHSRVPNPGDGLAYNEAAER